MDVPGRRARAAVVAALTLSCGGPAIARGQGGADTIAPEIRSVDGHVVLGTRARAIPVGGAWVVAHRIGPDSTGPLDSVRTNATGAFHIEYRAFGSDGAQYIVTTSHDGIAYFLGPLSTAHVAGDDANLLVYDTTSRLPIRLAARHLLVFAPGSSGERAVGEIFELSNDSTLTLIGANTAPSWTTHLPASATAFQLNPSSTIAAGAVTDSNGLISVFAALSPGMRQLAFTYRLAPNAFPLVVPMTQAADFVEILVQEPAATVTGAGLAEVAPVSDSDGRVFRRFVAQKVAANTVFQVGMPSVLSRPSIRLIIGVVLTCAVILCVAAVVGLSGRRVRRGDGAARRPIAGGARAPPSPAPGETLIRELAILDAGFERVAEPTAAERDAYGRARADLKARLTEQMGTTGGLRSVSASSGRAHGAASESTTLAEDHPEK